MAIAIKAESISKAYQLGDIGTGTLSTDIQRWIARARGKEDPFLKIGETNDRTSAGNSDMVWSLKDISFTIEQGDAVGIIGRNGAGKSTLLKVLSRVTSPTSGRITGSGRIASLLEVGTGFHPELTGRENIYLNGAILGMRKKEITRKFDEIVDFAGVERYIDTPVKRYSSGMYVRLAFAVAAHLESEILIVDEVLAVGDIEFQKKCLGKMDNVSKGEGRTILFVSHNMNSIASLCSRAILLNNGHVELAGGVSECVNLYYNFNKADTVTGQWRNNGNQYLDPAFTIDTVSLTDGDKRIIEDGVVDSKSKLHLVLEGDIQEANTALKIGYELTDQKENVIFTSLSTDCSPETWPTMKLGKNKISTEIPINFLYPDRYTIKIHISLHHQKWICSPKENGIGLTFDLIKSDLETPYWNEGGGFVSINREFYSEWI